MARLIDVRHLGRDRVIGAYALDDVVVDPGPASCVENLLEAVRPRALCLTHIHLDHAGATGVLVKRFPDIQVYVHERGAPHLVDPSKLLRSAGQLYGDDMDRLWGEVLPVPQRNVHALSGGETVEGLRVAYTPGHASHHVSYLDEESGDAYVGDVAGVRIPPSDFTLAPTPPPDIDLDRWRESLETVERWSPKRLCPTHFGPIEDVVSHLERLRSWLDEWPARAGELGEDEFVQRVEEMLRRETSEDVAERIKQAAPPDQLYLGLKRYLQKREESRAA